MSGLSINDNLLMIAVEAGVQLALMDMRTRGLTLDDLDVELAQERYQRTGTNTAILIDCIAVLAHVPGGIDWYGVHFETTKEKQLCRQI